MTVNVIGNFRDSLILFDHVIFSLGFGGGLFLVVSRSSTLLLKLLRISSCSCIALDSVLERYNRCIIISSLTLVVHTFSWILLLHSSTLVLTWIIFLWHRALCFYFQRSALVERYPLRSLNLLALFFSAHLRCACWALVACLRGQLQAQRLFTDVCGLISLVGARVESLTLYKHLFLSFYSSTWIISLQREREKNAIFQQLRSWCKNDDLNIV